MTKGLLSRAARVGLVGAIGVFALLLQPLPPDALAALQRATGLSPLGVRIAALLNPLLLTIVLALAGAAVAHRVGLVSAIAGTAPRPVGSSLAWAVVLGLLVAGGVLAADALLAPRLGDAWVATQAAAERAAGRGTVLLGMLYGGLAEEVMMRWGVMSVVLFALASLTGQVRDGRPVGPVLAWPAIAVAALAFAAAHLPALAQSVELTPAIVARTIGLNAAAGLVYGWLFWRRGLEAAMTSHAASHAGFALGRLAG